jgi:hypothetical protein
MIKAISSSGMYRSTVDNASTFRVVKGDFQTKPNLVGTANAR